MKNPMPLVSLFSIALLAGCAGTGMRDGNASSPASDRGSRNGMAPSTNNDGQGSMAGADASQRSSTAGVAPMVQGGDGLAIAMLAGVNEHEIAAARQAREKKVSAPVMTYANLMEREHTMNQSKTMALGTPAMTAEVQAMKTKKAEERRMLGQKSGSAYEAAYIAAMVKDHSEALALIDGKLMPAATSAPVRQHLTETRKHVAMHLEQARALVPAKQ